jgi:hypothetical protein
MSAMGQKRRPLQQTAAGRCPLSTSARRVEQVANIVRDGTLLGELAELFEVLRITNPAMSQRVGRALALARLAIAKNRTA